MIGGNQIIGRMIKFLFKKLLLKKKAIDNLDCKFVYKFAYFLNGRSKIIFDVLMNFESCDINYHF